MKLFENIVRIFKRKESFPPIDDFVDVREKFVSSQSPAILKLLQNDEDFVAFMEYTHNDIIENLQDQLDKFSQKLAQFQLGLSLMHKKNGTSLNNKDVVLSVETIEHDGGPFIYVQKNSEMGSKYNGKYLLQLKEAYSIMNNESIFAKIKEHWEIPNLTHDDLFLLAGIEEAAHKLFDSKSNKRTVISNEDSRVSYHISDLEFRALFWKSKIIKKYFPQYIDHMRAFIEKQKTLRHQHIAKN